jgi:hypothetical protein
MAADPEKYDTLIMQAQISENIRLIHMDLTSLDRIADLLESMRNQMELMTAYLQSIAEK